MSFLGVLGSFLFFVIISFYNFIYLFLLAGLGRIDLMGITMCMDASLILVYSALLDFNRTRRIQPIIASFWSRSAGDRRRFASQQRGRQNKQEESVLPMVVLWHMQWKPPGKFYHVLHSRHTWLGFGVRHPHWCHGNVSGMLLMRRSFLCSQATQNQSQT